MQYKQHSFAIIILAILINAAVVYSATTSPLVSTPPDARHLDAPPSSPAPDNLVRVDVHVCSKKWLQEAREQNADNLEAFEESLKQDEYKYCLDGFEDQGVEAFPIMTERNPSAEFPEEKLMQDIAKELHDSEAYTCISTVTQTNNTNGYVEPKPVSIPDFTDNPAPKGNLVSHNLKSDSRCPEGYTEHSGVFTDTVPKGYTTYHSGAPAKGMPPYRIIY